MKVKLFDGKVRNMAIGIIAALASIVSFLMGFNLIEDVGVKKYVLLGFCVIVAIIWVGYKGYKTRVFGKEDNIKMFS